MKNRVFLFCILYAAFCTFSLSSCTSSHDKMVNKIEAADKQLMADTLMKNDSLLSQQYKNLQEFTAKFPKDEKTPVYLTKSADLAKRLHYTLQAFMLYKQVNDSFPNTKEGADALFMMAYMYEDNFKNYDRAKECYEAFITKYPDHYLVKDARATLDMLNSGKTIEEMVKEWEAKADSNKTSSSVH